MKRHTDWHAAHEDERIAALVGSLPARKPSRQVRSTLSNAAAEFAAGHAAERRRSVPFPGLLSGAWFRRVAGAAAAAAMLLLAGYIFQGPAGWDGGSSTVAVSEAADESLAVFWTDSEDIESYNDDLFDSVIVENMASGPVEGRLLDLDGQITLLAAQIEDF